MTTDQLDAMRRRSALLVGLMGGGDLVTQVASDLEALAAENERLQSITDTETLLAAIRESAPVACKLEECHDIGYAVRVLLMFAWRAVNGNNDEDAQRLQSALTWTTERPTVPGWYWRKWIGTAYPIVSHLTFLDGQGYCDSEKIVYFARCVWSGPIPEPQERHDA